MIKSLAPDHLYTACQTDRLSFKTTAELEPLEGMVGQDRAVAAVGFAIGMRHDGFNLFAFGPEGTGKSSLIRATLQRAAADRSAPDDWCYVNNFDDPHRPRALALPAGQGSSLRDAMARLVEDLRAALPAAFESDEYSSRKSGIEDDFKERHEKAFGALAGKAQDKDVALIRTPVGLALAPAKDGNVLSPKEFEAMDDKERADRAEAMESLQGDLEKVLHDIPLWEKDQREQIRTLDQDVTRYAVGHLIDALKEIWAALPDVLTYLDAVQQDVIENATDFLPAEEQGQMAIMSIAGGGDRKGDESFKRFQINVIVDNSRPAADFEPDGSGFATPSETTENGADEDNSCVDQAPVVYEDHPTQPNLVGRVEHVAQFGTLMTDFNLIKAGALHRANGGFLVLDARKMLMQPFAWETLSRALRAGNVRVESPAESLGWSSTVTLQPEPIPLTVKVVLLGEPWLYYLLARYDPDFRELFKVAADFDSQMDRNEDAALHYARLIAGLAQREGLRASDQGAVARVVEQGARLAGDAEKLTAHMASVADLVREADYWAGEAGAVIIGRDHIQQAIDAGTYRSDRIRERIQEEITRETLVVQTDGDAIGEINGLAVYQLDHFMFGKPSRISCRVRMGKGEVIDIEREVALGGPLHSKGVLILSSYMSGHYLPNSPMALQASLVFEQSYGGIDGDSASSAELYVLLSALSGVPIKQSFAVTGSVDQHGRVQAIGGVNEKIEGFFDICSARGLTGEQGVLIPAANVKHLMLREDVVAACTAGQFRVFSVQSIDEGLEILTGKPAGARDDKGEYPIGSVNRSVEVKLQALARKTREFMGHGPDSKEP